MKTDVGLNGLDYTGIAICFIGIGVFLLGATRGPAGSHILIAAGVVFIVGLLVCAVGRIFAGR